MWALAGWEEPARSADSARALAERVEPARSGDWAQAQSAAPAPARSGVRARALFAALDASVDAAPAWPAVDARLSTGSPGLFSQCSSNMLLSHKPNRSEELFPVTTRLPTCLRVSQRGIKQAGVSRLF